MSSGRPGQRTQGGGRYPFSKRPGVRTIKAMASNPVQATLPAQEGAPRLGERLLALRLINEGQLRRALDLPRQTSRVLGAVLLELGILDQDRLRSGLSQHLEIPSHHLPREAASSGPSPPSPRDL